MTDKNLKYQFMERRVRGQAYVDIHVLPLPVPRYSYKVGSARITYTETGERQIDTIPYVNAFSYRDASELLKEIGDEFGEFILLVVQPHSLFRLLRNNRTFHKLLSFPVCVF